MGLAETAQLAINISLKGNASTGIKNLQRDLGKMDSSVARIRTATTQGVATASRNIQRIGAVGAIAIADQVRRGIDSLAKLEDAIVSVDGAIDQVGEGWTTTGADVAREANRIETAVQAAFDDKDITQGATALIRYGNLSEENLIPALEVMTDLAAKTGSVESASELLAKALADPAKAAGRLTRIGIVLTDAEQEQIDAMIEAGDAAGAQAALLAVLEKKTKGAAEAMHGPYRDAMLILSDVTEDAQRALGEAFLPVLKRVSDKLSTFLADPKNVEKIRDFGRGLADGFDRVLDVAGRIPWAQIGDAAKLLGTGAKALFDTFTSLPPWVQTAVLTGWGLNKLSGGALGAVLSEGLKIGVRGLASRIGGLFEDLRLGRGLKGSLFGEGGALRGSSPATPLYTKEVGLSAGGRGPGGTVVPSSKGGIGVFGKLFLVGEAIGLVAAVVSVKDAVQAGWQEQTDQISSDVNRLVTEDPSRASLVQALEGIDEGLAELRGERGEKRIGLGLVDPIIEQLEKDRAAIIEALYKNMQPLPVDISDEQQSQFDALRDRTEDNRIAIQTAGRTSAIGLSNVRSATQTGTAAIVAAIRANRPIVSVSVTGLVNTVVKTGQTVNAGHGFGNKQVPNG